MKSVFKIVVFLFLIISVKKNFSQTSAVPYYNNLNFHGTFFVIAESDERSNFYAINLSQLTSDIEKKYFESLTYKDNRLVRVDAGNDSISWYKVKKNNSTSDIGNLFNTLKEQTIRDISAMNAAEREAWLGANSK